MLTPEFVAALSDRCVAARLRGEVSVAFDDVEAECHIERRSWTADVALLCDWLARHWQPEGPTRPTTYPDAVSFFGQKWGSAGPCWYAEGEVILGFIPGTPKGCYVIPASSALPGTLAHAFEPYGES